MAPFSDFQGLFSQCSATFSAVIGIFMPHVTLFRPFFAQPHLQHSVINSYNFIINTEPEFFYPLEISTTLSLYHLNADVLPGSSVDSRRCFLTPLPELRNSRDSTRRLTAVWCRTVGLSRLEEAGGWASCCSWDSCCSAAADKLSVDTAGLKDFLAVPCLG